MRTFDAIDVRPVRRFLATHAQNSGYEVEPAGAEKWAASYWDTRDWRILRAGLQLRIRGATAQLIPLNGGDDSDSRVPTESCTGNPADLPAQAGDVAVRVRALIGSEPLAERVQVSSELQTMNLVARNGTPSIPVVLETMTIPVAGHDAPARAARVHVSEAAGPVFEELWNTATRACHLHQVRESRFNTACIALGIEPPGVPEIGPEEVAADGSVADVAYAVLRRHYRNALLHEPGTRLGDDPEELHDMRVSVRRMRSVIKMFRGYLPRRLLGLRMQLGWVGRALGEVRDLDVQMERLEEWRSMLDTRDRPSLDVLEELLGQLRNRARRRMLRTLDTRRYARLMERLALALARTPKTPPSCREPILQHAPHLIQDAWQRLNRAGRKIKPDTEPTAYHRLRIRCKSLRYALETHAPLYGAPARKMIRRLVALQDLLGDHQDAYVAVDQLRVLTEKRRLPAATVFAMGSLAGSYSARAARLRRGFPGAFAAVSGKRWKHLQRSIQEQAYSRMTPTEITERLWPKSKKPPSP